MEQPTTPENVDYKEPNSSNKQSKNYFNPTPDVGERIGNSFSIFFNDLNYWIIGFIIIFIQNLTGILIGWFVIYFGKGYIIEYINKSLGLEKASGGVILSFIISFIAIILILVTIVTIIYTYIYGLLQVTIIYYIKNKKNKQQISIGESFSYGFKKVWLLFSIIIHSIKYYILGIIIIIGGMILAILLSSFLGKFLSVLIGMIIMFYGVYLCIKITIGLTLAIYIGVDEELDGETSIKKSFKLSEGNLVRIFGNNLLMGLVVGFIIRMTSGILGAFIPQSNYIQDMVNEMQYGNTINKMDTDETDEEIIDHLRDGYNRGTINEDTTITGSNETEIDTIKDTLDKIDINTYFKMTLSLPGIISILLDAILNGFGAIIIIFLYLLYIAIKDEKKGSQDKEKSSEITN